MSFIFENGSKWFDRTLWPLYKSGSGSSSLSSGVTALGRQRQDRERSSTYQVPTLSLAHTVAAGFSLLLPLSEPHSLWCSITSPNNCYLINVTRLQHISESWNKDACPAPHIACPCSVPVSRSSSSHLSIHVNIKTQDRHTNPQRCRHPGATELASTYGGCEPCLQHYPASPHTLSICHHTLPLS